MNRRASRAPFSTAAALPVPPTCCALLAAVLLTTSLQHLGAWAVLADVADISAVAWHKR
jgi:hypothetical protein